MPQIETPSSRIEPGMGRPYIRRGAAALVLLAAAAVTAGPGSPPRRGAAARPAEASSLRAHDSRRDARPPRGAGGAIEAVNEQQGLRERFERAGVRLAAGNAAVTISMRGFGYGSPPPSTGDPAPLPAAGGARYAAGPVTEWFANAPDGLEQGFTIRSPPGGGSGPLTLALSLGESGRARVARPGSGVLITARGGLRLLYRDIAASDSAGRRLRAWIEPRPGAVMLRIDARDARYPIQVDPLIDRVGALPAEGESGAARIGTSVAVSADGATAIVGGPSNGAGAGAAWIFTRSGSTWAQQALLTGAAGSEFGASVSLSADGNTAIVGAPEGPEGTGAAWIFTRSDGTWSQGLQLTGAQPRRHGRFGASVAVAPDGSTALVGAPEEASGAGGAWAFARSGESWALQGGRLSPEGEVGAGRFGSSVSIGEGAETALVGAPEDREGLGSAWVFTASGSTWSQAAQLAPEGESGIGAFGSSVSLAAAADEALIGAPSDAAGRGAAWVFGGAGASWSELARLTGTDGGQDDFGAAVSIAPDGEHALVGAPAADEQAGAAWAFASRSGLWSSGEELPAVADTGPGQLGYSVATSNAGVTDLVGAPGDAEGAGSAWPYANTPTVTTAAPSPVGQTSATAQGTVDPNSVAVGACRFEYGPTAAYGSSAPCSQEPGTGDEPVTVTATLTGLEPATEYHYRLIASNQGGVARGPDEAFSTLPESPTVTTGIADEVAQDGADAAGSVDPNSGQVTSCTVEYGETDGYGSSAPCVPAPGGGDVPVAISAKLAPLRPDTTYHYRVVATNAGGTGYGADRSLSTLPEAPAVLTGGATSLTQSTATLNGSVDPNGGVVGECRFEYGPDETYGSSVPCSASPGGGNTAVAVSAQLTGLRPDTTYHYRVVATNAGGTGYGADRSLSTLPEAPTVVSGAATSVAQSTATLNGSVDPNGGQVTECRFEYGATTAYGSSAPCAGGPGEGVSPVGVSAQLTGLEPHATYHYRVVATNAGGTGHGADATFTTLPEAPGVVSGAGTSVAQSTATVNGSVDPNGGQVTECRFEYGRSEAYGSSVPCSVGPGGGEAPVGVSAQVTGLAPDTTYHYRVVATNAGGTGHGSDATLTTLPEPPTLVTGDASGVSQTGASLNATVDPNSGEVGSCLLEYGTSPGYGSSAPCVPAPGGGHAPVSVSATVSGLRANTTYHFRVAATNPGGTSYGSDAQFTTPPDPPSVVTTAASFPPTTTTATMNATVDPNEGRVTECRFEYGPSTKYGSVAACSPSPGAGAAPVELSATASGLSPNTTYHYRVVAANAGGVSAGSDVSVLTAPGAPTITAQAPTELAQDSAVAHASVDLHSGALKHCVIHVFELEQDGGTRPLASYVCAAPTEVDVVEASALLLELEPDHSYYFAVEAENTFGELSFGEGAAFQTLPGPSVTTGTATSTTQTSALLRASVRPNGGEVTACTFQYGPTVAYGSSVPCTALPPTAAGASPVSGVLSGLLPDTTYHFRIVVAEPVGSGIGADAVFSTLPDPPTVTSGPAGAVTGTSATVGGTVDPNGAQLTSCAFEYGPSISYGYTVPCTALPGPGTSPAQVSAPLQGLTPGSAYHYRLVAVGPGGDGSGADELLSTPAEPRPGAGSGAVSAFRGCAVALLARTLTVTPGSSSFAARLSSAARCTGLVRVAVRVSSPRRRAALEVIASRAFAMQAAGSAIVHLTLDRAGRALLRAGHGRLAASLAIVGLGPAPASEAMDAVRLLQAPARRAPHGR